MGGRDRHFVTTPFAFFFLKIFHDMKIYIEKNEFQSEIISIYLPCRTFCLVIFILFLK